MFLLSANLVLTAKNKETFLPQITRLASIKKFINGSLLIRFVWNDSDDVIDHISNLKNSFFAYIYTKTMTGRKFLRSTIGEKWEQILNRFHDQGIWLAEGIRLWESLWKGQVNCQKLFNLSKKLKCAWIDLSYYHKLVFSECNTAIFFQLIFHTCACTTIQLFRPLVTFGVTSSDSLTDSDLQLLSETEQDQMRHSFIQ